MSTAIKRRETKSCILVVQVLQSISVTMIFSAFIVASVIVVVVWYHKTYLESHKFARKLPGPPALPLLGNALIFLGKSLPQTLNILESLSIEYGKTVRFCIGPKNEVVLLTDPKDVQAILSSQKLIEKSDEYKYVMPWVSTGLLTATGQKHFGRRKVITPAFHFKILEQFVEVFDKHSRIFVTNLAMFKGQTFDIFPQVTLCALDIICGKMRKNKIIHKIMIR